MNFFKPAKKVLVADDEKDACLYLKKYLERKKLEVVCAFDGMEAKKIIEEQAFDYFLLDCSMPNVTGLELIESARKRNPRAKIILISGFPSINDAVIKKFGGDQFIHKPVNLSEIDSVFEEGKV